LDNFNPNQISNNFYQNSFNKFDNSYKVNNSYKMNNINNNFQNNNLFSKDKKINDLEEKINILNNQLLEEKNKNHILYQENLNLKKKIDELNVKNNNLNIQINPNNYNNLIKMNELYGKIADLQEKLNRFPFILEKNEKLMSIIFSSVGQNIHYSIVCKNTDDINKLERELYREYPQFSETDNYFMCKGKVINKFHTFESNHIKNGDVILVNQRDI
jgi:seryl-tRNA synthetase